MGRVPASSVCSPLVKLAGYVSRVCFPDENGYRWTKFNEVSALPIEAQEPHVLELKDGQLRTGS